MSCLQISLKDCAVISALSYSGKVAFEDPSNYRRLENFDYFIFTTALLYNANVESINHEYKHLPEMQREALAVGEVYELLDIEFFESLVKKLDDIDYFQKVIYVDYYEYQTCGIPDYDNSYIKQHIQFLLSHLKEKSGLFDNKEWGFSSFSHD